MGNHNNLKKFREQKGWSQEALAKKAGITGQTVSNLETGRNEWTFPTLRKLAKALGISQKVLLGKMK